jgi:hypothetical protein
MRQNRVVGSGTRTQCFYGIMAGLRMEDQKYNRRNRGNGHHLQNLHEAQKKRVLESPAYTS